ncbi:MAG: tetratricopeptide repeat protein [Hyphomonadaceae bacterium]|nr:tetratricopeptide repeat protein [Hyphomonadaceae bacterium]MBX3510798.1 tetratricopeptide repeat protein [Hyphomonadaceae bacterium]
MIAAGGRAWVLAACAALGACVTLEPPAPSASRDYADYLIGRVASAREDHAAAADRYFGALTRAPNDDQLISGALYTSLALGDEARARQAARMAARENGPALAHIVRAADALRAGAWRRADTETDRAQGAAYEELIARTIHLWARVGEGRVDDVLVQLEPLASMRPYGGLFAYQQAIALDYAGRTDAARAAFSVGAGGGLWLPAAIERHADLLARSGDQAAALALLSDEASTRGNPALRAALARAQAGQAPARTRVTPARGAAIGLYGLATIFTQEHDPASALIALSVALMLDPSLDEARLAFAQAQAERGNQAVALAALAQVPASSPYASSANVAQAWALLDEGQEEAALAQVSALAGAGDERAARALADMYRRLGRDGEAEAIYSRMIESDAHNWRLYFARAAARDRMGRWPDAEADLQQALALSPDQPDVLNYLGYSWADRGERLSEALAMIERAVEMRPLSAAVIDSLGWVHFRMGDYAEALRHLERAVELQPDDATLNDHLGDVYWRLGRRIEARFQWRRALALAPENAAALEAKIADGLAPERGARTATR